MSGNEERCVQRRINGFLREHFKWILFLPLIISLIAAGFYFIFPQFGSGWINILLTIDIAFFAGVQGYSTYTQKRLVEQRYRIEDLRNELKTAYGPLYTIVNSYEVSRDPKTKENIILLKSQDKKEMDRIFATYPFMFEPRIYNLWREKIQSLKWGSSLTIAVAGGPMTIPQYHIPEDFRSKLNDVYDRKVKEYNKLLKKE